MHSADELTSEAFAYRVGGRQATLASVVAGFGEGDRLGVVVNEPCGGVGASLLTLACVTAFYDAERAAHEEFFVYPDFFFLHVGAPRGDHQQLDIWPEHKEPVVPGDPEELLRAINDRAITHLLVPDVAGAGRPYDRETLASAERRVRAVLAYSATGAADHADVAVRGTAVMERYVSEVLAMSAHLDPGAAARARIRRRDLQEHGAPVERYRRVTLADGLSLLAGVPTAAHTR